MATQGEWLSFLREQFPVGSRIKLQEMKDPYHPVEPGTMGTLTGIDDMGTFHCAWDNGRGLGLVLGEDRFSVLPPETHTTKLYMPMTVDFYERNEWGDAEEEPLTMSGSEAAAYAPQIIAALQRERTPEEAERGLMAYYSEDDGVNSKVRSLTFTAEVRDGKLWGVAECNVQGELTQKEMNLLKEYVGGQASDGFGEGFEQHEIKVGDGLELYAHLWQWDNWSIQTEQEAFTIAAADKLPSVCYSVLPSDGSLIIIERGTAGYAKADCDLFDAEQNRGLADYNNKILGVSPAQEQAMVCGSMFGWDKPGADPSVYERESPQTGGMTMG